MKQQPRSRSPHGRPEYTGTCCAGDSEERKETEREVRQNDGGGSGMNVGSATRIIAWHVVYSAVYSRVYNTAYIPDW